MGTQHACASLCEELVTLWRLAALCPANLQEERVELDLQLREWHVKTIEKVKNRELPYTFLSIFVHYLFD